LIYTIRSECNYPVKQTIEVILDKALLLKNLIKSSSLEFICEAHNGLSAKIVQEAGFEGIWASGLTLSAQYGVRDNNEASWTQILDMVEFMSESTSIPILLDGDTGYGNFNSFRRLVKKLEKIEIGGVCIEDKLFPKTNSFISGERQQLADPDEFAGKIKAGKDTQQNENFCIIARTEALIAGWGLKEALRRSKIYMEAGADAILIHSSKSSAVEIIEFCKEWDNRLPVVIVPTKYYSTPTTIFKDAKISLVIWANHILRASIQSMQDIANKLNQVQTLVEIEKQVAPLNEIFRIQNTSELELAETSYLPSKDKIQALVLSAGSNEDERLKTQSLIRIGEVYKSVGINNPICVVNTYDNFQSEYFNVIRPSLNYIQSELNSLITGLENLEEQLESGLVIQYGDVIVNQNLLNNFLSTNDSAIKIIGVDFNHSQIPNKSKYDIIYLSDHLDSQLDSIEYYLDAIENKSRNESINDLVWSGIIYIPPHIKNKVIESCRKLLADSKTTDPTMVHLINFLLKNDYRILVELQFGSWISNENLHLMRVL